MCLQILPESERVQCSAVQWLELHLNISDQMQETPTLFLCRLAVVSRIYKPNMHV